MTRKVVTPQYTYFFSKRNFILQFPSIADFVSYILFISRDFQNPE